MPFRRTNKKLLRNFTTVVFGAEDRNRTGTNLTIRGILSPLRLPVPPPRQVTLKKYGGGTQNRTGDKGFADLCLTAWLCRHMERKTGLEPATPTLARLCSTTELLPHLATRIRFELTISAVTGRHVRPLHHRAASYLISISITPCFVNNLSASYRH